MISGIHLEVWLAAGYAVFLGAVAFLLEFLARQSHQRSEQYRNSGFVYRREMDLWDCPAGRQLTRTEVDYQRNIVYYRAPAEHCNRCSLKANCTDADDGRQLRMHLDSWIESELRRFHRGISLSLLLLSVVILAAEMLRHAQLREIALSATLLVISILAGINLLSSFLKPSRHS